MILVPRETTVSQAGISSPMDPFAFIKEASIFTFWYLQAMSNSRYGYICKHGHHTIGLQNGKLLILWCHCQKLNIYVCRRIDTKYERN